MEVSQSVRQTMFMDTWHNPDEPRIEAILRNARSIAVVGCSPKPDRASHQIAAFLIEHGYDVVPVNPMAKTVLGRRAFATLADIPQSIDIVNVFRKPEYTPQIAREAVAIGSRVLWLQQGIISEAAWKIATDAGLDCIMDRCIAVMHRVLIRD